MTGQSLNDAVIYAVTGRSDLPSPEQARQWIEEAVQASSIKPDSNVMAVIKLIMAAWLAQYTLLRNHTSRLRKAHERHVQRIVKAIAHGWSVEEFTRHVIRVERGKSTAIQDAKISNA